MLWAKPGRENTDQTLDLVVKRAQELNITRVVVASNSGETCKKLLGKGLDLVCVTHHVGFIAPGRDEMGTDTREFLRQQGVKILTTTHLFAGVDRAIRNKFGGAYPAEIMAQTLRIFGQGVKVAIEVACMAKDAGLIPHGEEVISIGGTATGADSAIVMLPAHSNNFFETEVREIICMPRCKTR